MLFFGSQYEKPYFTYGLINKKGELEKKVPIDLNNPNLLHDFGITENYIIIPELPLLFNP